MRSTTLLVLLTGATEKITPPDLERVVTQRMISPGSRVYCADGYMNADGPLVMCETTVYMRDCEVLRTTLPTPLYSFFSRVEVQCPKPPHFHIPYASDEHRSWHYPDRYVR